MHARAHARAGAFYPPGGEETLRQAAFLRITVGAEVERPRRERDALRQQNSRTCRKYGLKSRRQRGKG